jgi:hypothetical protein
MGDPFNLRFKVRLDGAIPERFLGAAALVARRVGAFMHRPLI